MSAASAVFDQPEKCSLHLVGNRRRLLALAFAAPTLASAADDRCADLQQLSSPARQITDTHHADGVCRVTGIARPHPGSRIGFEIWMPDRGWTGRYVQLGTGGFAGTIFPAALAAETRRGNAVAMTDSGHVGDRMSAAWAAGNRAAVIDYGHRSIKVTSDAADALIRRFYGRAARYRYFAGCSNGGRQALMAAQCYPADWDGVLAGSPAAPWTEQLYRIAALQHRLSRLKVAQLSRKLPLIQSAALAACPAGTVRDGVASAPASCGFAVEDLLCRPGRSDCLTDDEATAVAAIVAAGYEPTAAAQADGWGRWITDPDAGQIDFAEQAFRYLLQFDPGWTLSRFQAASARRAALRSSAVLDPGADLSAFVARGGKALLYVGWADALIAPRLSLGFYDDVVRAAGGPKAATRFARMFKVPGMGHCQGGTAPYAFGQNEDAPALVATPDHDIRAALEAWVERDRAPSTLIAWHPRTGQRAVLRSLEDDTGHDRQP